MSEELFGRFTNLSYIVGKQLYEQICLLEIDMFHHNETDVYVTGTGSEGRRSRTD